MVFRTCTSLLATIHQRSVVGCCSFEFAGSSNQRMSRSRHVSFRHFAPSSKRSGHFAHPDRHGCSGCQRSHQSLQSAAWPPNHRCPASTLQNSCRRIDENLPGKYFSSHKFHHVLITFFLFKAETPTKIAAKTSSDPVYWLDRLASVFRNMNVNIKKGEQHPCQSVITYTWPCLSMTLDKFQTDRRVMERCCRCLRFALRLIGHQSAPLLQPLVTQVSYLN